MATRTRLAAVALPSAESSRLLLGVLLGAFVAVSAGYSLRSAGWLATAFHDYGNWYFDDSLFSCGTTTLAALAAASCSRWTRLVLLAGTLAVATALIAVWALFMGDVGSDHRLLVMAVVVFTLLAQSAATGFGIALALDAPRSGARSAVLIAATAYFAGLVIYIAGLLARKVNPDFLSPTSFFILVEPVAALAAFAALVWLLLTRPAHTIARQPRKGALIEAWRELWRARRPRLMVIGNLIQTGLVLSLAGFGDIQAGANGPVPIGGTQRWLPAAAVCLGMFAGAMLADRRRAAGRNAADIAVWAVAAGLVVYLFAVNVDDAAQSIAFLSVAGAICGMAWGPTYVLVNDSLTPRSRPAGVAMLVLLAGQLSLIGLPYIAGELALKLAGAVTWTMGAGFWGKASVVHHTVTNIFTSSWRYALPVRISADLGDADSTLHTARTACILLTVALAGPLVLYRLAGSTPTPDTPEPEQELASPRTIAACPTCGAANEPTDRFCQQCGGQLPAREAIPAAPPPLFGRGPRWSPLAPMLIALGLSSALVVVAMIADAQGLLHKRWTAAAVWKAPDGVDQAIKDCKDWPCLFGVVAKYQAPSETVKFLKELEQEAPTDDLGYPIAFDGKGRVKVVTVFEPGLGMEGMSDFVYVNGTKAIVRPNDNIDQAANVYSQFMDFKAQYPQVLIWGDMAFHKEVLTTDGSQQFQFQLTLLNGCHACEVLGVLDVGYNFDKQGHYTGMTIVGVEPDKNAPYAALLGRLRNETQFFQNFTQVQPDGRTATIHDQTILQEKDHCRLAVETSGETFTGGSYQLENVFSVNSVTIEQTSALNAALAAAASSAPANPAVAPPQFAPPAPINSLAIACNGSNTCISQDYSDQRGHASPLPWTTFTVPVENVDATIRDFQALQAMCAG